MRCFVVTKKNCRNFAVFLVKGSRKEYFKGIFSELELYCLGSRALSCNAVFLIPLYYTILYIKTLKIPQKFFSALCVKLFFTCSGRLVSMARAQKVTNTTGRTG